MRNLQKIAHNPFETLVTLWNSITFQQVRLFQISCKAIFCKLQYFVSPSPSNKSSSKLGVRHEPHSCKACWTSIQFFLGQFCHIWAINAYKRAPKRSQTPKSVHWNNLRRVSVGHALLVRPSDPCTCPGTSFNLKHLGHDIEYT